MIVVTMVMMMELVIVKLVFVDEVLIVDVGWLVSWLAGWLLLVVGWLVRWLAGWLLDLEVTSLLLRKWKVLQSVQDRNETLFYRLVFEN